jgi:hypothetical protein
MAWPTRHRNASSAWGGWAQEIQQLHAGLPFQRIGTRYLVLGDILNQWVIEGSKSWAKAKIQKR